jgi:hypothetical protein
MKYVKYISVGLSLSGKAGKTSYLHTDCYRAMNVTTAGPSGEIINGNPPSGVTCAWCGKSISPQSS